MRTYHFALTVLSGTGRSATRHAFTVQGRDMEHAWNAAISYATSTGLMNWLTSLTLEDVR